MLGQKIGKLVLPEPMKCCITHELFKSTMKRATVFRNGTKENGKIIKCEDTLELVMATASDVLDMNASIIYTATGGHLTNAELIRDDEILYISQGEPFIDPKASCYSQAIGACTGQSTLATHNDWVTLNVGGKHFSTTRSTLIGREPDSMLARMFADDDLHVPWHSSVDHSGAYLIDRSPSYFEPVLNYLRHGQLILDDGLNPAGVLEEAIFFGITSLYKPLEEMIKLNEKPGDHTPITRREFVLMLQGRGANCELRCQGMNFERADLSKLDLRYINLKLANLSEADLSGANMSFCCLERTNMTRAKLNGANLQGVRMVLANLEGASLIGCNFEDPLGRKANMEGVNMKGVNLENSQMAGVNLRVATLKNANLKNSNLRGAVLAGTDLENCNLTGCDLQEANLRGANVKNATFEEMLTPLHMSQSVR